MKLHEMRAPKGARKHITRLGRGTGSGKGKTAGRGTKGQLARSGPGLPGWFEGGQTPLHMRVPKLRGFKPLRSRKYVAVNVDQLAAYAEDGRVSPETLHSRGLVRPDQLVKILGTGSVGGAFAVRAHAVSGSARQKIEAAGGSVTLIGESSDGASERPAPPARAGSTSGVDAARPKAERVERE